MSAAQALASSRFLNAMGPMIMDENKMANVLKYIITLRVSDEPCRFTEEEIVEDPVAEPAEEACLFSCGSCGISQPTSVLIHGILFYYQN